MSALTTIEEAIRYLKDDQDEKIVEYVMERINSGEFVLGFSSESRMWEVRGNYQTLMGINAEEGVIVSDELLYLSGWMTRP